MTISSYVREIFLALFQWQKKPFSAVRNHWRTLKRLLGGGKGGGRNFNYQHNIETDDRFKCHDTIKFIAKKVNHCCFSGTALETFSRILLGGTAPRPP